MADGKTELIFREVKISGLVQGVGFRPFVRRAADKHKIRGSVKNSGGEVVVRAVASERDFGRFIGEFLNNPPEKSVIEDLKINPLPPFCADCFEIEASEADGAPGLVPPDAAVCERCAAEALDKTDRRFGHFFISCADCGARFTVINSLPYDRDKTANGSLPLCEKCASEYGDPADRRFHAESISCNDCGQTLFFSDKGGIKTGEAAFLAAVKALKSGEIIAVKGIGGYHYAADPFKYKTVKLLRELKRRENKPFAVMFGDVGKIEEFCEVSPHERSLLTSPERPIVLLKKKYDPFAENVNLDCGCCGCFLPYTELHNRLTAAVPALILTSANGGGEPIKINDAEFSDSEFPVLYHDREIKRSAEDSVVRSVFGGKTQIIRRARGFVPLPVKTGGTARVLAMGGDLKPVFSLSKDGDTFLSGPLGDLSIAGNYGEYYSSIADFSRLFSFEPEKIACDPHPRYLSRKTALELAEKFRAPLVPVFHHHAHAASVSAEYSLFSPAIGVVFDGAGYGEDGGVWGGEFLIYDRRGFTRAASLAEVKMTGSDALSSDAELSAACFLHALGLKRLNDKGAVIGSALENDVNTHITTSMGRLFDAAAALSGIRAVNTREGECGEALQSAAENTPKQDRPLGLRFELSEQNGRITADWAKIIEAALKAREDERLKGPFALGFHAAVSEMVGKICVLLRGREKINAVTLSGGVFLNRLLLRLCAEELTALGFEVYFNTKVPPSDYGLALGQSFIAGG